MADRTAEGDILLALRHPWSDGTTHLLFGPLELLERLAVLIPRPRVNLRSCTTASSRVRVVGGAFG
jgi:hypothetical protein